MELPGQDEPVVRSRPGCRSAARSATRRHRDGPLLYLGEDFHIRGETAAALRFDRVEVTPTFPLFADVVAHTTGGARLTVLGLFKDQARQLADHLRTR